MGGPIREIRGRPLYRSPAFRYALADALHAEGIGCTDEPDHRDIHVDQAQRLAERLWRDRR